MPKRDIFDAGKIFPDANFCCQKSHLLIKVVIFGLFSELHANKK